MALLMALAVSTFFLAAGSPETEPTTQQPTEHEVKAAFLFNFAKFVDWPAGTFRTRDEQFQICVLGDDAFREILANTVTGKTVAGRPIAVVRVTESGQISACRMLFVGTPADRKIQSMLNAAGITSSGKHPAILTIADDEAGARDGLIIQFLMNNGKVRFEIDAAAAERAGIYISARLLSLAQVKK